MFTFNKEKEEAEGEEHEYEVCTNYRYARRHDPHH